MLLRKFIGKRLARYYAQPSNLVVGSSPEEIQFSSLLGEFHWRSVYRRAYKEQNGQWMTPVELFKPHFSRCFSNFIANDYLQYYGKDNQSFDVQNNDGDTKSIHIVELGGGRGTNANIILSHLKHNFPDIYEGLTYTLIDSSPSLHELQQQVIGEGGHGDKVQFVLADLMDVAEGSVPFLTESSIPTYSIALELLDNLPHDKIVRCKQTFSLLQTELATPSSSEQQEPPPHSEQNHHHEQQQQQQQRMIETYTPLTDPLLKRVANAVPAYTESMAQWVPTVACGVIENLFAKRPNSNLILADFDWLPPPDIPASSSSSSSSSSSLPQSADNAPLITCMNDIDHECYLDAPDLSDILFPTDFQKLALFVREIAAIDDNPHRNDALDVRVRKQAEFLETFGTKEDIHSTKSWFTGYSPLLEDFGNCSVLTVTKKKKKRQNKHAD